MRGERIMPGMLDKKVCLITGSGRGIGAAIARKFAEEGAFVYANDNRIGTVEEWAAGADFPGSVTPVYFDITDTAQVKNALMRVKKEAGRLDVLVNNAGIEFNELIGMISEQNMRKMFEVNVFSMINMLQFASRIMARNSCGGSIINIASIVGQRGNRGQLVYSATKGAVISLTKSAAKELAGSKIRVNAGAPGMTKTAMMLQADPSRLQESISNISMGRLAEPEDIANACLFLASDLSGYVSGEVLGVNGCAIM